MCVLGQRLGFAFGFAGRHWLELDCTNTIWRIAMLGEYHKMVEWCANTSLTHTSCSLIISFISARNTPLLVNTNPLDLRNRVAPLYTGTHGLTQYLNHCHLLPSCYQLLVSCISTVNWSQHWDDVSWISPDVYPYPKGLPKPKFCCTTSNSPLYWAVKLHNLLLLFWGILLLVNFTFWS